MSKNTNENKENLNENKVDDNSLNEEIKKLKESHQAEKEKLLRIIAECENKIKRSKVDAINSINLATENIALDFTPIIDNIDNVANITENETKTGLILIVKSMKKILYKYGVEEISPKEGDEFNPDFHQATSSKESDLEPGKIVEVLSNGYKIKEKTITAAMVIVSK